MNRSNGPKNDKKKTPKMTSKKSVITEKKTDLIPLIEYGDLMTSEEVCEFLKISIETLYKWVENGVIPHYRITGKKILFNKKTICKWLNEKMVG